MEASFLIQNGVVVNASLVHGVSTPDEPLRIQDIWGSRGYKPEPTLTMEELGLRAKMVAKEFCEKFQQELKDVSLEFMDDNNTCSHVDWYGADEQKGGWKISVFHPDTKVRNECWGTTHFTFSEVCPSAQRRDSLSLISHTDVHSYKGLTSEWYLNRETGEITGRVGNPTDRLEFHPLMETVNIAMKAMLTISRRFKMANRLPTVEVATRRQHRILSKVFDVCILEPVAD